MQSHPVLYFEIPVADMGRAKAFYERVFRTELELACIDGNSMALFPSHDHAPGATGALAQGESYVPGKAGARLYFSVADIDGTVNEALAAGATLHYPITEVPAYGWVAELVDTEGNCIALHAVQRLLS